MKKQGLKSSKLLTDRFLKEEMVLDALAELLVDDFLSRKVVGKLPKTLKREKKSVRK